MTRHHNHMLRYCAISRSGHHAIMRWIGHHFPEPAWHFNNCRTHEKPTSGRDRLRRHPGGNSPEGTWPPPDADALTFSFENANLRQLNGRGNELSEFIPEFRVDWGRGRVLDGDVIIMRDPANNFASCWARLARPGVDLQNARDGMKIARVERWKQYAKEFLRDTRFIQDPICVSFNHWFASESYRRVLSRTFGLEFTDAGLQVVAYDGAASTFDRMDYDGRAQEMPVMDRWRGFVDDPWFRSLFDQDLWDLAGRIWDSPPGMEEMG